MTKAALQRGLSKLSEYPRWAVFNIVSVVLVTICILISAPLFVKVWKPQNELDLNKLATNTTVTNQTINEVLAKLSPFVNATSSERVKVRRLFEYALY